MSDPEVVAIASTQFVLNEWRGYTKCIAKDPKTGSTITFNNAKSMVYFVEQNPKAVDFEQILRNLSLGASITFIAADLADLAKLSKLLGVSSSILSAVVTVDDIFKALKNPDIDTVSDVIISVIGIFGGIKGAAISIGLSYAKKGITSGATETAKFFAAFEKTYINYISQSLLGIDIK